jgi:hypothetical protein
MLLELTGFKCFMSSFSDYLRDTVLQCSSALPSLTHFVTPLLVAQRIVGIGENPCAAKLNCFWVNLFNRHLINGLAKKPAEKVSNTSTSINSTPLHILLQ